MQEKTLGFAQILADSFQKALKSIYESIYSITTDLMEPFLVPVLSLYFIFIGYQIIMGNINKSKDVLIRLVLIFPLLFSVIFSFETYNEFVSEPILNLKDFITQKISSLTGEGNMFAWLDTIFIKLLGDVYSTYFEGNILFHLPEYILGILLIAVFFYLYVYATVYSIQSLVYVGLLLLIGPVFLFFLCFNFSKSLFFIWLRTLMTYFMYSVFLALILVFIYNAINISANKAMGSLIPDIFTIFIGIISITFVKGVPELSNAITQGASSGHEASNFTWSRIASNMAKKVASAAQK